VTGRTIFYTRKKRWKTPFIIDTLYPHKKDIPVLTKEEEKEFEVQVGPEEETIAM